MKKKLFFACLMAATVAFTGCEDYDDSEITAGLESAEDRLDALEDWQMTAEQQLAALEAFTAALEGTDYVVGVEEIKDGATVVGYQIEFAEYGTITVYNGTDGEDGEDGEDGAAGSAGSAGSNGADGDTWFTSVDFVDGYLVVETEDGEIYNLPVYCDITFTSGTLSSGKLYVSDAEEGIDNTIEFKVGVADYRAVYVDLIEDDVITKTTSLTDETDRIALTEGTEADTYVVSLYNGSTSPGAVETGILEITVVLNDGSKSTRSIAFEVTDAVVDSELTVGDLAAAIVADKDGKFIIADQITGTQEVIFGDDDKVTTGSATITLSAGFAEDGILNIYEPTEGNYAGNLTINVESTSGAGTINLYLSSSATVTINGSVYEVNNGNGAVVKSTVVGGGANVTLSEGSSANKVTTQLGQLMIYGSVGELSTSGGGVDVNDSGSIESLTVDADYATTIGVIGEIGDITANSAITFETGSNGKIGSITAYDSVSIEGAVEIDTIESSANVTISAACNIGSVTISDDSTTGSILSTTAACTIGSVTLNDGTEMSVNNSSTITSVTMASDTKVTASDNAEIGTVTMASGSTIVLGENTTVTQVISSDGDAVITGSGTVDSIEGEISESSDGMFEKITSSGITIGEGTTNYASLEAAVTAANGGTINVAAGCTDSTMTINSGDSVASLSLAAGAADVVVTVMTGGTYDSIVATSDNQTFVLYDNDTNATRYANIADDATEIAYQEFMNNQYIQSAEVPASVTSIGASAFQQSSLVNLTVSGDVAYGNSAFKDCASLAVINFEDGSGNTYAESVFTNCNALTSVDLGDTPTIGYQMFAGVDEKDSNYNQNWASSKLSITIPNTVTEIGGYAFSNYTNLESVTFEETSTLSILGYQAFTNTSVTTVTLPATVTKIGFGAFASCGSLTNLTFLGEAPTKHTTSLTITTMYNDLFWNTTQDIVITVPSGKAADYMAEEIFYKTLYHGTDAESAYTTKNGKVTLTDGTTTYGEGVSGYEVTTAWSAE
ncbi:MAG: leucine-rich repeat domain-containing protein [Rikenellaceae bacterium]